MWTNQQGVKRATIDALNIAVPKAYKRGTGANLGVKVYRVKDNPRDILNRLTKLYGKMTSQEKMNMETQ